MHEKDRAIEYRQISLGENLNANILNEDTIVASASGNVAASVGIVRVSGELALSIGQRLSGLAHIKPRHAHYAAFRGADAEVIDSGLLIYFPKPHSFTGEDVVEIQVHGNSYILAETCAQAIELGARAAQPGEFSRRAFSNGRVDLAQAEAIADLISSQSRSAALAASRSLQGELSEQVVSLEQQLTQLRAYIEASLDFPDEEIEYVDTSHLAEQYAALLERCQQLQRRCQVGMRLQQGAQIVLTGKPNVGKSSLLNALLAQRRAIVSDQPGTTRDLISAEIELGSARVTINDTAGIRSSDDSIEQQGVAIAQQALASADLMLLLLESGSELASLDGTYSEEQLQRSLILINKIDLQPELQPTRAQHSILSTSGTSTALTSISLSAKSGAGLELLRAELEQRLRLAGTSSALGARARHIDLLQRTQQLLVEAQAQAHFELAAEHLRQASATLTEITGTNPSESLLDSIFTQFCLGK